MDLARVDPLEVIARMTAERKCLPGRYTERGIYYELRTTPNGGIALKWWPYRNRDRKLGAGRRLTLLKLEGVITVARLRNAVIRTIDAALADEKARVEEEATAAATGGCNPLLDYAVAGSY